MSARKDDSGKPPLSLIPRSALYAEARVMATGAVKYCAHNWRGGMKWSRLIDAAMRHLTAFADGQDIDDGEGGSNESHLANARCCLAFLIEYAEKGLGEDDRYMTAPVSPKQAPGLEWSLVHRVTGVRVGEFESLTAAVVYRDTNGGDALWALRSSMDVE